MRRSLLTDLLAWKDKTGRKPLLLQGARQVGKTTLLHQFGQEYFPAYHLLNFEKEPALHKIFERSLDPLDLLNELSFHLGRPIDKSKDLLILDEIQACPRALTSLKYFAEEAPEMAVAAAGSLLGVYLGPVSFPVGKVDILTLYPMSFEEFLLALEENQLLEALKNYHPGAPFYEVAHERLFERLIHYFIVGGLPEVVKGFSSHLSRNPGDLFVAFEEVRKKQNDLITSYLADIAKHSGKINAMHIARVWQAVPGQLADTHEGHGTKFKFKGVVPGIDRYSRLSGAIDWLEAAKLVIKVPIVNRAQLPFSAYADQSVFKLYLFDVGLLGALANLSPHVVLKYDYGSYKGYFAENYVAQALIASGHKQLYSWQEKQAEVEFLLQEAGSPIPLEVKAGRSTKSLSAERFVQKYHAPYKILLSAQNFSTSSTTRYYPLYWAGNLN